MKQGKKVIALATSLALIFTGFGINSFNTKAEESSKTRYEIEDAQSFEKGGVSDDHNIVTSDNYSGGKAIGGMNGWANDGRAYSTTNVNVDVDGMYKITIAYAATNDGNYPTIDVRVNNGDWISITAPDSESWDKTTTISTNIELIAGENKIDVTGACLVWYDDGSGSKSNQWANVDYFELEKIDNAYKTVRYEAEDAESFEIGGATDTHSIATSDNYSGGKAVGGMNAWANDGQAYLTKKVNVEKAGIYQIAVGYAGSENGNEPEIQVRANEGAWKAVKAPATPGWDQVKKVTLEINLKDGENIIDVTGACQVWYQEGQNGQWVNIDYFELTWIKDEAVETTTTQKSNNETTTTQKSNNETTTKVKISKAKIKAAKNVKSKKIKLTLVRVKKAKGYEIQYATNSKFKKAKTIKTTKLTYTIKKLKKKKTYYIRVRAYNGKTKGAWSSKKKIKVTR